MKTAILPLIFIQATTASALEYQTPLQYFGEPTAHQSKIKQALDKAFTNSAARLLNAPQKLQDYLEETKNPQQIPIRSQSWATQVQISPAPGNFGLVPFYCAANLRHYLGYLKVDLSGLIADSIVLSYPDSAIKAASGAELQEKFQNSLARWQARENGQQSGAIKLSLALSSSQSGHGKDLGLCLNTLLAAALAKTHRIVAPLATSYRHFLSRWFTLPAAQRANRSLRVLWRYDSSQKQWQAALNPSEAVFASSLGANLSARMTKNGDLIDAASLENFIQVENLNLDPRSSPKVIKKYGAWVYLDKGRAWGLEINDRLTATTADGPVRGHVIGYFGSDSAYKDSRGGAIGEGAILFIRSGQKKVSLGDQFKWDSTSYPK